MLICDKLFKSLITKLNILKITPRESNRSSHHHGPNSPESLISQRNSVLPGGHVSDGKLITCPEVLDFTRFPYLFIIFHIDLHVTHLQVLQI